MICLCCPQAIVIVYVFGRRLFQQFGLQMAVVDPQPKKVCERDLRGIIHPPDYHHFSQSEVCIVYNFVHDSASTTQLTLLVTSTLQI